MRLRGLLPPERVRKNALNKNQLTGIFCAKRRFNRNSFFPKRSENSATQGFVVTLPSAVTV